MSFSTINGVQFSTLFGRIQKSFAGTDESTAALGMPEEGSRVRALYAHFQEFRWIGRSKNSSIAS
jgi:hypothetical protein